MTEKTLNSNQPRPANTEQPAQLPPPKEGLESLALPKTVLKSGAETEITAYDIKKGDTLAAVARKYGMLLSDLQALNPKVKAEKLEIGERLLVKAPQQKAAPANSESYYVKKGDTFDKIAKEHDTSIAVIAGLNPKADPRKLFIGQRILIPAVPALHTQKQPKESKNHGTESPTEKQPASQAAHSAVDTANAFKVLSEYQKRVEAEGRPWVVSQKSRPNPEAIKAINDLLNAAGAEPPLSGSVFTSQTFEALKRFQAANGLVTDGKFGAEMLEAFRLSIQPVSSSNEYISLSTRLRSDGLDNIRQGQTILRWESQFDGKEANREDYLNQPKDPERIAQIRNLQNLLNDAGAWPTLETTGIFDSQTKKAVMNFQKSQKLSADGSVGKETIKALDLSRDKYLFALKRVLGEEGGVSNDKDDPGGLTFRGVTQITYDSWRDRHHLAAQSVTQMSPLEARALYRELYWLKSYCDQCPKKIATVVFDCAVNCGVGTARNHLHQACSQANVSIGEIRFLPPDEQRTFGSELIKLRREHHKQIIDENPKLKKFRGWWNRIDRLEALVGTISDNSDT